MSSPTINGQNRAKSRQPEHTQSSRQRLDHESPRNPRATGEERLRSERDSHTGEGGRNPQEIEPGAPRRERTPRA